MAAPTSTPEPASYHVDAPPSDVAQRLQHRLLPIRSVWFPTPRELREWSSSGVPLYVRRLRQNTVEVGPRLASLWAACFAPVWVLSLHPHPDGGTHVKRRRRLPRFTLALLAGWWAILVAWPAALWWTPEEDEPGRWLIFWAFLVVASTLGPLSGAVYGGRTLDDAEDWLRDTLQDPPVDEDW